MRVHPLAAFVGCLLIWGTTWIVIREGIADLPALGSAGLRTGIAALVLVALALAFRSKRPSLRGVLGASLVGVFLFAGNLGLIYVAEKELTSSATVILYSTLPLQVAVLAPLLVPGERFAPRALAGATLGIVGVALSYGGVRAIGLASGEAALAAIGAATMAGVGTALGRRHRGIDPLWMNAIGNAAATLVLALAWAIFERESPIPQSGAAWGALLYLTLIGSVVAFVLYAQLLRAWPAARASYVSIGAYALAIAVGVLLAEEPFTWTILGGGALVLIGAAFSLGKAGAPKSAEAAPVAPERS